MLDFVKLSIGIDERLVSVDIFTVILFVPLQKQGHSNGVAATVGYSTLTLLEHIISNSIHTNVKLDQMRRSFKSLFGSMLQPLQLSTELKLCFHKDVSNVFSIPVIKKKHVTIVLLIVYLMLFAIGGRYTCIHLN